MEKLLKKETKGRMILRLLYYMIKHPIRAFSLLFHIKKGNLHFGDHFADICYLKYGKIEIPKEEKPLVSIIIPVYNQLAYTYQCLRSIARYTQDVPYEIIIGDDLSMDGTRCLSSYVENINIIRNHSNLKFLKNCNHAAESARGKYVLFLNNDTEVTEGWLSSLVTLIESDPKIGMVGSKLIFPSGRLQEAGGVIFRDGSGINFGKWDDSNKAQYNYVREVDYISGASIMLSKELWDEIGGFDEYFAPAYCEDSDLAFEVRKRGLKVMYQPKSVVIHYEGVSNGKEVENTSSLKHYQVVNTQKLKEKWKKALKLQPVKNEDLMDFSIRDRIQNKKVVVFVDHLVPEFDKDAGSKNIYQYLQMFLNHGYLVKFIPDNYYQSEPYTSILEQMGIEVLYGSEYSSNITEWFKRNQNNIDVIYLNRPHVSMKYIDFIKEHTNIKIIYYGQDLHFLREKREYEVTKDKQHLEASEYWKEIELDIMRKSAQVYYPSYVEKDLIESIDPKINVKAINAYCFDHVDTEKTFDYKEKEGLLFVGGFNHRPNIDAVLWFTKEIYPRIRKHAKIPFYIVGSNPTSEVLKLGKEDGVTVKGYVTEEELKKLYETSKMVVVPLRYGAGIKGKVIEAMSEGIPLVTTSIGAEGISGIEKILPIADEAESFADQILKLYRDEKVLQEISKKEREFIHKNYSSEAAWKIIEKDFSNSYKYLVLTSMEKQEKKLSSILSSLFCTIGSKHTLVFTSDGKNQFDEKKMDQYVKERQVGFIFGENVIDGSEGIEKALSYLALAKKMVEKNGKCYVFCSFKEQTPKEITRVIKALPKEIQFFLSDETSYKNFINATRKTCSYLPDFSYFTEPVATKVSKQMDSTLEEIKGDYNLIGVNFSHLAWESFGKEKKEYVEKQLEVILKNTENPYLVFLHYHDSEKEFIDLAKQYCELHHFTNFKEFGADMTSEELCFALKNLEVVVTGHTSLALFSLISNVIPIIYYGEGDRKQKIMNIMQTYMKTSDYVVSNGTNFKKEFIYVEENAFEQMEYLNYFHGNREKQEEEFEKLQAEFHQL